MSAEAQTDRVKVQFSTEISYFSNILEGLECVRDEGKIIISDDSIYSSVVDPSNAMMCVARIKGRALNGLDLKQDEDVTIGVDYEKTMDLLSGFSDNSELEFSFPVVVNSSHRMRLNVVDEDAHFDKSTIDPDTVPGIPSDDPIENNTKVVVSGKELKKNIDHAEKMIDVEEGSVIFGTEGNAFYMKTSDKVEGSFRKNFYQSGPTEGSTLGNIETQMSMSYINDIKKSIGNSDEVTVQIRDSYPIRFDVDLDENGDAKIIYVIAPRVDEQ